MTETGREGEAEARLRVLFVCSRNRLRSPTAEEVFAEYEGLEVASAGLNHDSETPLTRGLVQWADLIFVMEQSHRKRLTTRFQQDLKGKRVICLEIPDRFERMAPELVALLERKVPPHLRVGADDF